MADKKVSAMAELTKGGTPPADLNAADLAHIVDDSESVSKKSTLQNLADYFATLATSYEIGTNAPTTGFINTGDSGLGQSGDTYSRDIITFPAFGKQATHTGYPQKAAIETLLGDFAITRLTSEWHTKAPNLELLFIGYNFSGGGSPKVVGESAMGLVWETNWFTAGAGAAFSSIGTNDLVQKTAHGFKPQTRVYFESLAGGGGELVEGNPYYVISDGLTTNAFKISAVKYGAAVNIGTAYTSGKVNYGIDEWQLRYIEDKVAQEYRPWFWYFDKNDIFGGQGATLQQVSTSYAIIHPRGSDAVASISASGISFNNDALVDGAISGALTTPYVDHTTDLIHRTSHGLIAGDRIRFTALSDPTGGTYSEIQIGKIYYVISGGLTANAFKISTTSAGSAIAIADSHTSGTIEGMYPLTGVKMACSAIGAASVEQVGGESGSTVFRFLGAETLEFNTTLAGNYFTCAAAQAAFKLPLVVRNTGDVAKVSIVGNNTVAPAPGIYVSSDSLIGFKNSTVAHDNFFRGGFSWVSDGILRLVRGSLTDYGVLEIGVPIVGAPTNGQAASCRLYCDHGGAGAKMRLMAIFDTGAAVEVALEP